MDLFTTLLNALKVESAAVSDSRFTAPWSVSWDRNDGPLCVTVLSGECHAVVEGGVNCHLRCGDTLLTLQALDSSWSSAPGLAPTPIRDIALRQGAHAPLHEGPLEGPVRVKWGGGRALTRILAFSFRFQETLPNPLIRALPAVLPMAGPASGPMASMRASFEHLLDSHQDGSGFGAVVCALANAFVVGMLREYVLMQRRASATAGLEEGWLQGILDPRLARVLAALHADPAGAWSVQVMSKVAGMSRSAFFRDFQRMVGCSPMAYLGEYRLLQARQMMVQGAPASLVEVAHRTGFGSVERLRHAFKQRMGTTPSAYRREVLSGNALAP